jgi:hypothetical protein
MVVDVTDEQQMMALLRDIRRELAERSERSAMLSISELLSQMRSYTRQRGRQTWRHLAFAVKATDGIGAFEGLAAVYLRRDDMGDIIEPGAFREQLQQQTAFPLLWQHDLDQVLGVVRVEDTSAGLRVRGRLNLAVARAQEVYELIKQGAVRGLSIGFNTLDAVWRGATRHVQKIRLYEISLTSWPAQPLAIVETVKAADRAADIGRLADRVDRLLERMAAAGAAASAR